MTATIRTELHKKECMQNGYTYEYGSGHEYPKCTCKPNTVTISREVYVRVRELVEMRATKDTHPYYQDAVKQFLEAGK